MNSASFLIFPVKFQVLFVLSSDRSESTLQHQVHFLRLCRVREVNLEFSCKPSLLWGIHYQLKLLFMLWVKLKNCLGTRLQTPKQWSKKVKKTLEWVLSLRIGITKPLQHWNRHSTVKRTRLKRKTLTYVQTHQVISPILIQHRNWNVHTNRQVSTLIQIIRRNPSTTPNIQKQ